MVIKFFLVFYVLSAIFCIVSFINLMCIVRRKTEGWKLKTEVSQTERFFNKARAIVMITLISTLPVINILVGLFVTRSDTIDYSLHCLAEEYRMEKE